MLTSILSTFPIATTACVNRNQSSKMKDFIKGQTSNNTLNQLRELTTCIFMTSHTFLASRLCTLDFFHSEKVFPAFSTYVTLNTYTFLANSPLGKLPSFHSHLVNSSGRALLNEIHSHIWVYINLLCRGVFLCSS